MPHKSDNFDGFIEDSEDAAALSEFREKLTETMDSYRRMVRENRKIKAKPGGVVLAARGLSPEEEEFLDIFLKRHEDAVIYDSVQPGHTTHFILGLEEFDLVETLPGFLSLAARIPIVSSSWLMESLETIQEVDEFIIPLKGARSRESPLFNGITFSFSLSEPARVPEDIIKPLKEIIEAANGKIAKNGKGFAMSRANLKVVLLSEGSEHFTKNGVKYVPVTWVGQCLLLGTTSLPQ